MQRYQGGVPVGVEILNTPLDWTDRLNADLENPDFGFLILIRSAQPNAAGETPVGAVSNMTPADAGQILAEYAAALDRAPGWGWVDRTPPGTA